MRRLVPFILLLALAECPGCPVTFNSNPTGPFMPMAKSGPYTITVDGVERRIDDSYYLALPDGLQFTMDVTVSSVPPDKAAALTIAWPYMRDAYLKETYLRSSITKAGSGPTPPVGIGVALVVREGIKMSGYRIGLKLTEIQARLAAEQ